MLLPLEEVVQESLPYLAEGASLRAKAEEVLARPELSAEEV